MHQESSLRMKYRIDRCLAIALVLLVSTGYSTPLSPTFYAGTCPGAIATIRKLVRFAVAKEARMGASLLRLHFHDCFVNGCDASVLLDDTPTFIGEKTAPPNVNSLRGFEVIDSIKARLEIMCPGIVSCSDIVAVAARESVFALGGPFWNLLLGRRDSTTASFSAVTQNLIAPTANLSDIISGFSKKGFSTNEMVALYGAHTIGLARCVTFRNRIYNETNIDPGFARARQANCPTSGGDNNLAPLDSISPARFDSGWFFDLVARRGLLHSDQQLYSGGFTNAQVDAFARNARAFRAAFANSMFKMSNLSPLTATSGQIRTNCRKVN